MSGVLMKMMMSEMKAPEAYRLVWYSESLEEYFNDNMVSYVGHNNTSRWEIYSYARINAIGSLVPDELDTDDLCVEDQYMRGIMLVMPCIPDAYRRMQARRELNELKHANLLPPVLTYAVGEYL